MTLHLLNLSVFLEMPVMVKSFPCSGDESMYQRGIAVHWMEKQTFFI